MKMKGMFKGLLGALALTACTAFFVADVSADTGVYVGKDASTDGTIIIGRSDDYAPGMLQYAGVVAAGQYKEGDSFEQANGYSYVLPEDCLKYNYYKTMNYYSEGCDDIYLQPSDVCATNECGVSVNSSVACWPNTAALISDPYIETGISDEYTAQILAATSKSAREAVELYAQLIDESGSMDGCIVLISDQNEAWMMEVYTGHQYAARKLPDNAVTVFGDAFIFKTINPEEEDVIVSPDFFKLAEENGFAVYNEDESLNLLETYSGYEVLSDENQMRVWIGQQLFAPSQSEDYFLETDIPDFYEPDNKVSLEDIFELFRNRYEGTEYCPETSYDYYVSTINSQSNGGVYINQSYPDVPAQIGVVTWATPANMGFSPFLPMSNAVDCIPEGYGINVYEDGYRSDVAQMDFAKLCSMIYPHRTAYGRDVIGFWNLIESYYEADYADYIKEWSEAYEKSPRLVCGDANASAEEMFGEAWDICRTMADELSWSIVSKGVPAFCTEEDLIEYGLGFDFCFDVEEYAETLGWDVQVDGDVLTAVKDGKTVVVDASEEGNVSLEGFDADEVGEFITLAEADESEAEYEEALEESEDADDAEDEDADDADDEDAEADDEDADADDEDAEADDEEEDVEEIVETDVEADVEITKATDEEIEEAADVFNDAVSVSNFELGMILSLDAFFAQELESIPDMGLTRDEAIEELSSMSDEAVRMVQDYFGKNIDEIDTFDLIMFAADTEAQEQLKAEAVEVENALYEAGVEVAETLAQYYDQVLQDAIVEFGKTVSYDQIADVISMYAYDTAGLMEAYVMDALSPVINTEIDTQELYDILTELSTNAQALIEEYLGYSIESIDITIDVPEIERQLGISDEEIIDTLSNLDPEVIDGLSEIFGTDVGAAIDEFIIDYNTAKSSYLSQDTEYVIDFSPVEYYEAAEPVETVEVEEVIAADVDEAVAEELIEPVSELAEEDYEVSDEVVEILTEAMNEVEEAEAYDEYYESAYPEAEVYSDGHIVVWTPVIKSDGKIMIPFRYAKLFRM